ncbi:MAG: ABC transporter permease subunit [Gammaproteobacteria bacterium]|nr:ABC transporter permease subunit [Gammaproteobacteria bacterium]
MRELFRTNASVSSERRLIPNRWDLFAILFVFSLLVLLALAAKQMSVPYQLGEPIVISLSPSHLPSYALQSVLRMFIALFFSLLFTFTVGTLAAKNKHAEKILVPVLDILQSIPVMGFLSITVVGFIDLFPGSLWGAQCAAIFAIFTAQVWNMVFSFYQSMRTLPTELRETADMFHLSAWQRFWRVEVPFAMPGLLWNTMLSMSGSWFFVVASEAVTVSNQTITLPGIGSYIAIAIQQRNIHAILLTILVMLAVILLYDQLLFRPLIKWSERFRIEQSTVAQTKNSWMGNLFHRTFLMKYVGIFLSYLGDKWINIKAFRYKPVRYQKTSTKRWNYIILSVWYVALFFVVSYAVYFLWDFVFSVTALSEIGIVFKLGLFTACRVFAIVLISTLVWVPLGVWIGLRSRIAEIVQPIAQFLAAFPANLLFPFIVLLIVHFNLNVNIWTTPLMLLGTQWYILFNVIAGASALPKDLRQATDNLGVKGWLWWRRLILPGIFPYYVTGAITAAGNAWNTSTVAEVVTWGSTTLHAEGLGAFIMKYSADGNFPLLALGIGVMALFVVTFNRILWRPLYNLAQRKYQLD